jgi:hypothetical protein
VIHPGKAGTITVYPPSSVSGSRIMVYFLMSVVSLLEKLLKFRYA